MFRKRKRKPGTSPKLKTLGAHLFGKKTKKKQHILILNVQNILQSANHFKMHSTYRMPIDLYMVKIKQLKCIRKFIQALQKAYTAAQQRAP